jgi:transposase, IS5 family
MEDGMKQLSFGESELQARLSKDSALSKISVLLNWDAFKPLLSGLYRRETKDQGGERPYDSLNMFKAILLGQWHSLSDPELQEALQIRLDFIAFCGFALDEWPDDTTLCRFRNRLITAGKLPLLLKEINRQLQTHGLMMQKTKGAIVDATLITSAARPRTEMIVQTDDSGTPITFEDGSQPSVEITETHSADPDATWVKKGKKSHFGYRVYDVVDDEGYLLGSHTAPANQSEMNHFIPALEAANIHADNAERVLTDKGSASKAHRDYLKSKKIKCGIMHKAVRNKPLCQRQKRANKLISKTRYRVEQFFGTLKRKFDFRRASYIGTVKVNAQMLLKGMCANLLKAANKIQIDWDFAGISPSKNSNIA